MKKHLAWPIMKHIDVPVFVIKNCLTRHIIFFEACLEDDMYSKNLVNMMILVRYVTDFARFTTKIFEIFFNFFSRALIF